MRLAKRKFVLLILIMKKNNFIMFLAASVILLAIFVISNPKKESELVAEGYNADLSGQIYQNEEYGFFQGNNIRLPEIAYNTETPKQVLGSTASIKWIEVDLSDQKIYAWEGDKLYLESLISSGLPGTPTPQGEFRVWMKLRATKMEGGSGRGYYYLPNVPYVMFFENSKVAGWKGYGLHGTYWHNDFGRPKSHGCVNLPTPVAQKLYEWVSPELRGGKNLARADASNLGTRIVIHE